MQGDYERGTERISAHMNSAQNEPCKMGFIKYECALCGSFDRPCCLHSCKVQETAIHHNYFHIEFNLK